MDVRLMIEEVGRHDISLPVMPGVARLYDEAIARGESGRDHISAFQFPVG